MNKMKLFEKKICGKILFPHFLSYLYLKNKKKEVPKMGRLEEFFNESAADGGSKTLSLEDRIAAIEEMIAKLSEALIGSSESTDDDETEETVEETTEIETKEDEQE